MTLSIGNRSSNVKERVDVVVEGKEEWVRFRKSDLPGAATFEARAWLLLLAYRNELQRIIDWRIPEYQSLPESLLQAMFRWSALVY